MTNKIIGLCFRCENRANVLEKKAIASRCECKDIERAVVSCYMYTPIKPVVTEPAYKNDIRPRFAGAMISKREKFSEIMDGDLAVEDLGKGRMCLYWKPKAKKRRKDNVKKEKITKRKKNT